MNIAVEKIKVAERIRKLTAGVDELAKDIQKNGLINPITVMAIDGDDRYQLLAGLRRFRAAQALGWEEIAVTVVSPKDAEAALNIEYSENVQREAFTFSEKMDYARLIDEIEKAKAKERKLSGKQIESANLPLARAEGRRKRETRTIVGDKIGMSGPQYDRAKYIADRAPREVIDELDRGERTVFGTYEELRATEKSQAESDSIAEGSEASVAAQPVVSGREISARPAQPEHVPETDLERAIRAERELDAFKYRQHNEIYHRDSIIDNLKRRVTELETALEAANARIRELEEEYHAGSTL